MKSTTVTALFCWSKNNLKESKAEFQQSMLMARLQETDSPASGAKVIRRQQPVPVRERELEQKLIEDEKRKRRLQAKDEELKHMHSVIREKEEEINKLDKILKEVGHGSRTGNGGNLSSRGRRSLRIFA
jgi:hypothetical protein